ncbi:MAG: hypothetical protein KDB22_01240 [Planctomycetales bacterium]|nr:hypothetical protein [Planctomycetales bacterium]
MNELIEHRDGLTVGIVLRVFGGIATLAFCFCFCFLTFRLCVGTIALYYWPMQSVRAYIPMNLVYISVSTNASMLLGWCSVRWFRSSSPNPVWLSLVGTLVPVLIIMFLWLAV